MAEDWDQQPHCIYVYIDILKGFKVQMASWLIDGLTA